ncbi:non-specific lipid transfer protein GPI-anchored 2-like isoform X1 [Prosopis cineraria]|uniref:non-specific lipid transfer protein GPI-anchored 2-like isoform X1 n=1 Tax=Prosopis cineraria TaxID=364024 RepID=UPI00240F1CD1|nr:non-specific lipid transfer protein GPI-anchored 2-like isoform X1 [Prosopis cineraria]
MLCLNFYSFDFRVSTIRQPSPSPMAFAVPSLLAFIVVSCSLLLAEASPSLPPAALPQLPSTASPVTSPAPTCTDELVLFSPCLSYVASPPNDLADAASANCCNAFYAAAESGVAVCFCYLLREPPILGFPLNSSRLLSLSSDCPLANGESAGALSMNSLCSESPALPPLNFSPTLGLTVPSASSGSGRATSSQAKIPSKGTAAGGGARGGTGGIGGGGARGGSSGSRGGNGARTRPGGGWNPHGVIGGAGHHHSDSSSKTQICRNTRWLLLITLLFLLMTYMCAPDLA